MERNRIRQEEDLERKNLKYLSLVRLTILTAMVVFSVMPITMNAEVHNLNTGFNYSTIQAAIDNVSTLDGHTLMVYPGIYTENVIVHKSLTIKSTSGNPADTIINASDPSSDVMSITADNVLIANLTLTGADGGFMPTHGVKISANNCTLINNKLHHNGISVTLSAHYNHSKIINNEIYSNKYLAAILMDSGGKGHYVFNNSIHSNDGKVIYLKSDNCTLENNSIVSNVGRAIDISGDYNEIKGNYIENNEYGIYLTGALNNNITNCTIVNSSSWDFYSTNSVDNTIQDTLINQTKVSFTGLDVALKSVLNPPADPSYAVNIGKYLNITNNSANSWIYLNVSYLPSDLGGMDESKLKLYKHVGAAWQLVPGSDVNTVDDFVYANITSFSVFAPMASKNLVHNLNTGFNYSTIQAAIDNVSTLDGHTLMVYPGIYTENVIVNKSLTIKSTSGNPADTIVNASTTSDHVFDVTVNNVTISGFTIKDAGSPNKAGIYLNNVDNCTISNNNLSDNGYGICLNSSSNNYVEGNILDDNHHGIHLEAYSNNNTLRNNTVRFNSDGIYMESSSNNTVIANILSNNNESGVISPGGTYSLLLINNTIYDNYNGIRLTSFNSIIMGNNLSNNYYGIYMAYDGNNVIANNTALNNTYGFYLYNSWYDRIDYNNITGNYIGIISLYNSLHTNFTGNIISGNINYGIELSDASYFNLTENNLSNNKINLFVGGSIPKRYNHSIDTSNTVNGKPVYYLFNKKDMVLDDLDTKHITIANCTNITVINNNVSDGDPISLVFTQDSYILNNTASDNYYGIRIYFSSNNTIANNFISESGDSGILLYDSHSNNILNSSLLNNHWFGVHVLYSTSTTISSNTISGNPSGGVDITGSNNTWIYNNTIILNDKAIEATYSNNISIIDNNLSLSKDDGVYFSGVVNAVIKDNIINSNNSYCGVVLYNSNNTEIIGNGIRNSTKESGISLTFACNNTIANNTLSNNRMGIQLSVSSNDNKIINNTVSLNEWEGIRLEGCCENNIICDNTAYLNTKIGIILWNSSNNEVINNTANFNGWEGIRLFNGSNNNIVSGNDASYNVVYHGILVWLCDNNTITNNIVSGNNDTGIRIHDSNNTYVFNNTVCSTRNIDIYTSGGCLLYTSPSPRD